MGREGVGKALVALGNEELRQSVASGSLEGLGDLGLSDDEKSMLVGAANDYPEASGYSFDFGTASPVTTFSNDRFGQAASYAFGSQFTGGEIAWDAPA